LVEAGMSEITRGSILSLIIVSILLAQTFFALEAQEIKKIPRIGVLVAGHPPTRPSLEGFRHGLRELGYVEHKNIVLELRWDEGKPDPWSELADDLVRLKVDVILAGHTVAALGAKQATTTIPIVIGAAGGDPVAAGLVASLARPGGNVTGLSFVGTELSPKRLELLKESIPRLSRAAVIWHPPSARKDEIERQDIKVAAESLRVKLQSLAVRDRDDFDAGFHAARQEKPPQC
jgi:putative tryptophan/tyrosine transport system substrate-binding protein